jgi:sulfur carrier protein
MIEVNGHRVEYVKNENVKQLLMRMKYSFPLVVTKINDEVIPRNKYSDTIIPDNSKISIIHMISGG